MPPLTAKILPKIGKMGKNRKNQEKEGENWEKEEKLGRKDKNHEGSFTLPLLTGRNGYTTVYVFQEV